MKPGSTTTVRLVKPNGPDVEYPAIVLRDDGTHVVVEAEWSKPTRMDLGFVTFEPDDRFTEHYWRDRWYSVKEIRGPDGAMKGWWCDVARPVVVGRDLLVSEDLYLDLWCSADGGSVLRLDEDEFERAGIDAHDPEAAAHARAALEDLERLAVERFRSLRG